jgi:hypothetical protein
LRNSNYRNKTLGQAISRYAPSSENNTDSYIKHVEDATGYDRDTPMQDIIDNGDLSSVADAIEDHEGYSEGNVTENSNGYSNTFLYRTTW